MTKTYTVSRDGKSITCRLCGRTSHNPNDVENRYCGACHVFHDDLVFGQRRYCRFTLPEIQETTP